MVNSPEELNPSDADQVLGKTMSDAECARPSNSNRSSLNTSTGRVERRPNSKTFAAARSARSRTRDVVDQ